jgi:protoporphyrinogen oxidase
MKIGIVGAGIAGLTAAYELGKAGHQVTIFEKDTFAGGLASGFKDETWEWPLERFYHHLFQTDKDILDLAKEIGAEVIFRRPVTAMWSKGAAYPFDSPISVLRFPHLGLIDKMRTGFVVLYLKFTNNWKALEAVTAHEWLPKYMGKKAYTTLWEPLLIGKFGAFYKDVNMAWFWARIHKRSASLGYFRGGFQAFVDTLYKAVEAGGGTIKLGAPAQHIEPTAGGMRLFAGGAPFDCDRVIVTLSPGVLARLAPTLPPDYLAQLIKLDSMGAVVMTAALKQPLTKGLYWINMRKDDFPFLALVEHTNYMDGEHYGGDHVLYLGDYLPADHEYFRMTKEQLEDRFFPSLTKVNPAFDRSWVRKTWLHRELYAQPVVKINHSRNVPAMATPMPNLYFASMAQVYPWDRGTNYAVELGKRVAALVMEK